MFELIEYHNIQFDINPDLDFYSKSKGCLITILRTKLPDNTFLVLIVANVHLSYNKNKGNVKLAQLNIILNALVELKGYYNFMEMKNVIFLCGDFNSTPSSAIFRLITQGSYDCKSLPITEISGQNEAFVQVSKDKSSIADFSEQCSKKLSKGAFTLPLSSDNSTKDERCDMMSLTKWYMNIINAYIDYDFIKKRIKIKLKLPLDKINEYSKNLKTLNKEKKGN